MPRSPTESLTEAAMKFQGDPRKIMEAIEAQAVKEGRNAHEAITPDHYTRDDFGRDLREAPPKRPGSVDRFSAEGVARDRCVADETPEKFSAEYRAEGSESLAATIRVENEHELRAVKKDLGKFIDRGREYFARQGA